MLEGEIRTLIADKGFGFLKPRAGGDDVFFHHSVVDASFDSLSEGLQVHYELDVHADKPRACSVKVAAAASRSPRSDPRPAAASRSRDVRRGSDRSHFKYGFVTKLHRKRYSGFISSIEHGPEFLFVAGSVVGEKRFSRLEIGDYVKFLVGEPDAENPKQPVATAVEVVPREPEISNEKQLRRHPKALRKKPTWR